MQLPMAVPNARLQLNSPRNTMYSYFCVLNKRQCHVTIHFTLMVFETHTGMWVQLRYFAHSSLPLLSFAHILALQGLLPQASALKLERSWTQFVFTRVCVILSPSAPDVYDAHVTFACKSAQLFTQWASATQYEWHVFKNLWKHRQPDFWKIGRLFSGKRLNSTFAKIPSSHYPSSLSSLCRLQRPNLERCTRWALCCTGRFLRPP